MPLWLITFDEKERAQWITRRVITGGTTRGMPSTRRSRRADTAIIGTRTTMNPWSNVNRSFESQKAQSTIKDEGRRPGESRSIVRARTTVASAIFGAVDARFHASLLLLASFSASSPEDASGSPALPRLILTRGRGIVT